MRSCQVLAVPAAGTVTAGTATADTVAAGTVAAGTVAAEVLVRQALTKTYLSDLMKCLSGLRNYSTRKTLMLLATAAVAAAAVWQLAIVAQAMMSQKTCSLS